MTGIVGKNVELDAAKRAAELCAIQHSGAGLRSARRRPPRVKRPNQINGFVASAQEFTSQHLVINGASDLLVNVLGEAGKHARAAVGMACLPLNASSKSTPFWKSPDVGFCLVDRTSDRASWLSRHEQDRLWKTRSRPSSAPSMRPFVLRMRSAICLGRRGQWSFMTTTSNDSATCRVTSAPRLRRASLMTIGGTKDRVPKLKDMLNLVKGRFPWSSNSRPRRRR